MTVLSAEILGVESVLLWAGAPMGLPILDRPGSVAGERVPSTGVLVISGAGGSGGCPEMRESDLWDPWVCELWEAEAWPTWLDGNCDCWDPDNSDIWSFVVASKKAVPFGRWKAVTFVTDLVTFVTEGGTPMKGHYSTLGT